MNERFTIDDMIEFYKSEFDYNKKERDRIHKKYFNGGQPDSKYSFLFGMYVGLSTAYNTTLDQLIRLKKNQNDKKD